jgi:hypothetical protein
MQPERLQEVNNGAISRQHTKKSKNMFGLNLIAFFQAAFFFRPYQGGALGWGVTFEWFL